MPPTARVLIVDDDPSVLEVLRTAFAKFAHGRAYHVVTVTNGVDALRAFQSERPDLVVVDLRMPGMSGLQLLERIRAIDSGIPIMVVTGYADTTAAAAALRSGVFAYIPKPFDSRQLDNLTALCLEHAAGSGHLS